MKVKTTRFGTMEIDENKLITFPGGIPGFENLRRFFILPVEGTQDIQWLQAVEKPEVALLVIDPFKFFKGYSVDIPEIALKELEIKEPSEALVLTTITVPRDNPGGTTANLVAPIVINTRLKRAKQVILNGSPYTTRHRLFPESAPTTAQKEKQKVSGGVGK